MLQLILVYKMLASIEAQNFRIARLTSPRSPITVNFTTSFSFPTSFIGIRSCLPNAQFKIWTPDGNVTNPFTLHIVSFDNRFKATVNASGVTNPSSSTSLSSTWSQWHVSSAPWLWWWSWCRHFRPSGDPLYTVTVSTSSLCVVATPSSLGFSPRNNFDSSPNIRLGSTPFLPLQRILGVNSFRVLRWSKTKSTSRSEMCSHLFW